MKHLVARDARLLIRSGVRAPHPFRPLRFPRTPHQHPSRLFHASAAQLEVKPYLLADIGEGITECQVIQWFVKPGARVEQFDKICEVQSDKATVEITSRFDGVIKKLYYEADDVAKVGKPLVDIDIQSDISPADEAIINSPDNEAPKASEKQSEARPSETNISDDGVAQYFPPEPAEPQYPSHSKYADLATPAVRHMLKRYNINIRDVQGTGKDGRVLKEDVQKHVTSKEEVESEEAPAPSPEPTASGDKLIRLTPVQKAMYKTMTASLNIPHFLYTDTVNVTNLNVIRHRLNEEPARPTDVSPTPRLSPLPFIVKAVSMALTSYPLLNSYLNPGPNPATQPQLIHKAQHDIGIAMDTPAGLVVPVVRHVQAHSVVSLAAEISRLADRAKTGKLAAADLANPTFTVSNIGSIGGTVVAPVIVPPQVAILGIGQVKTVPQFGADGTIVKSDQCVFSWSADHRVVDGAMAARCAERVRYLLEKPEDMLVRLK